MKRYSYLNRALDDLARADHPNRRHDSEKHINRVIDLLTNAQIFQLPDNGHIVHGWGETPDHEPTLRLPFPVTAAEVNWNIRSTDNEAPESMGGKNVSYLISPRRIAVGVEIQHGEDHIEIVGRSLMDQPSVVDILTAERLEQPMARVTMAISYIEAVGRWIIDPTALVDYYVDVDMSMAEAREPDRELRRRQIAHGYRPVDGKKRGVAIIMPGFFRDDYSQRPEETWHNSIGNDVGNEADWMHQLTTALACQNVSSERISPPKLLQSERRRRKKLPLFDYHLLTLGRRGAGGSSSEGSGTHAGPRTHLRRGHIRRLGENRTTWVNETIVNPGHGFVEKGYIVKATHR